MLYIALGAVGFGLVHLLDLASLKRLPLVKPALWLSGTGLVVYAAVMAAGSGETLSLPAWLRSGGWLLLAVSLYLMVYSLYITLPFSKTYVQPGGSGQLVTGGLYSLVRHPWLLFFSLAMTGLFLGSASLTALAAGISWTLLSVILVYFQDRYVFPRMFAGYADYRKRTPMLWPTRNSLSAFFKGLKHNQKLEEQTK